MKKFLFYSLSVSLILVTCVSHAAMSGKGKKDKLEAYYPTFVNCTFLADYRNQTIDADLSLGNGTGIFTCDREGATESPGTYFDSSGVMQLQTATSDTVRYNYGYYDTSGYHAFSQAGVVIEGASTNYIKNSFGAADTAGLWDNWTISENDSNTYGPSVVDVSSTFAIGGTVTSQRIEFTAAGDGTFLIFKTDPTVAASFAQGDKVTLSCWLKGTVSGLDVELHYKEYDNGAVVGTTHGGPHIQSSISNTEWRRFTFSTPTVDVDCDNITFYIYIASLDAADSIDLQVACAQVEKLPFASSFIPTTTAALTRNAETLKYEIAGNRNDVAEGCVVKLAPGFADTTIASWRRIHQTDGTVRYMRFAGGPENDVQLAPNETDSSGCKVSDMINDSWTAHTEMTLGYNFQSTGNPNAAGFYQGVADGTDSNTNYSTIGTALGTYFFIGSSGATLHLYGTIFSIGFWDVSIDSIDMVRLHNYDWNNTVFW